HSVLSLRLVKALATPRLLHSFPTRRSSDLAQGPAPGSATGSHAVARQRSCCAAPAPGTRPASPGGGGSRPDGSSAGPGSRPPPPPASARPAPLRLQPGRARGRPPDAGKPAPASPDPPDSRPRTSPAENGSPPATGPDAATLAARWDDRASAWYSVQPARPPADAHHRATPARWPDVLVGPIPERYPGWPPPRRTPADCPRHAARAPPDC